MVFFLISLLDNGLNKVLNQIWDQKGTKNIKRFEQVMIFNRKEKSKKNIYQNRILFIDWIIPCSFFSRLIQVGYIIFFGPC